MDMFINNMDYLKVSEVASMLQISEATVRKKIKNNQIVAIKVGNLYRISRDELKNYCQNCKIIGRGE